ncbi:MAG: hypothetical protein R3C45_21560 [Phycisphaerales bacterium]
MPDHSPPGPETKPGHGPQGLGRDHPHKAIPGPVIILGSALGCVVLFFIVWGTLRAVEHHLNASRANLIWAQRATWTAPAVIETTLVKPNAANAQYTYNKPRYRDPGFELAADNESQALTATELAKSPDFQSLDTLAGIVMHSAAANDFYTDFLIATWHRLHGRDELADAYYQWSVNNAPRVLVIQYHDPQGNPVANLKLDRVEIGCDRVTHEGQTLDQRLVLVFPYLQTDAAGRVYLPVYDTTYRPAYLPQPDGYKVTYTPDEGWFTTATRFGLIKAQARSHPE